MKINCAKVTVKEGTTKDPGRFFRFFCHGGECDYRIGMTGGDVNSCHYRIAGIGRCDCRSLQRDWLKENAR